MKIKFSGTLTLLLLFVVQFSFAQQKTIKGIVNDENGLPLSGTTILIKDASQGTSADFDGKYAITVNQGSILVFSFVGYTTQEVSVENSTTINVIMQEDTSTLDEVVVVAYGTQKREEITGSVTTIKSDKINNIQSSSVAQGLVGKISGVQIINQTGQPGEDPTIRFRGIGSINSSNAPLYVVDGVVFNGNINSISNQDIESMSFLKDASANALYGSRGANGVIIITTKRGKKGRTEITIDSKIGFNNRAVPEYDILTDPGNYYEAWYNAWRIGLIDTGVSPNVAANTAATNLISNGSFSLNYNSFNVPDDQVIDPNTGKLNPNASLLYNDDWNDASFNTGFRSENFISVSTSDEKSDSYFSLGHLKDEGYAIASGFERVTGRMSTNYKPTDWLKIGGNLNYAHTSQDSPIQGLNSGELDNLFYFSRSVAPIYPIFGRDTSGNFILDGNGNRVFDYGSSNDNIPGERPTFVKDTNPIATSTLGLNENVFDNLSARVYATVTFLKDFEFTYNYSADIFNGNTSQFDTPQGGSARDANGRISTGSNRGITTTNQQLLNWKKDYGKHSFSLLVGHENFDYNFRLLGGTVIETLISTLPVLDNGVNTEEVTGNQKDYRVEGFLSRFTYDFDNKYFLNASFRRDGSSVFHPDNRWGNFYGLGAAWSVNKEAFLQNVDWLSNLRLKASIGQQGNDALLFEDDRTTTPGDPDNRNYYAYLDQSDVVNDGNNTPGLSFFDLGNKDLVWETSTNINAGFEIGLFNGRINLNAEYFQRKVEDLLFYNPVELFHGVGSKPENIGDMQNDGIEIEISADVFRSNNFNWSVNLNGTHYKNKITKLPDDNIDDGSFRLQEGRSRYDYFMPEWAGVDPSNGDALWYVVDDNGNKSLTNVNSDATEVFVGKSAIPDVYGGFSSSINYKGFGLNLGFAYQIGGYGFDGVYQGLLSPNTVGNNFHNDIYKTWTPENKTANIPRIDVFKSDQNGFSDYFLVDASYLSLQDVTLSYDFKSEVLNALGLSALRLYATANNVELWTNTRKGYDPRLSVTGSAINEYSLISTTSFGATVKF